METSPAVPDVSPVPAKKAGIKEICKALADQKEANTKKGSNKKQNTKANKNKGKDNKALAKAKALPKADKLAAVGGLRANSGSASSEVSLSVPKAKALPKAKAKAKGASAEESSASYAERKANFKGTAKEWLESEARKDAIMRMTSTEVQRRRFESYRPDLYKQGPDGRWILIPAGADVGDID